MSAEASPRDSRYSNAGGRSEPCRGCLARPVRGAQLGCDLEVCYTSPGGPNRHEGSAKMFNVDPGLISPSHC